ncbi:MAG: hypothetical protein NTX03_11445 [Bacteroidetes bacterium]|nr:hypothetical protein [Bacteroidota bacterium]
MGGCAIAHLDSNEFSLTNPASSAKLGSYSFETGLNVRFYTDKTAANSYRNLDYNVPYFGFAIPLDTHRQWGLHMGLTPLSRISYFSQTESSLPYKSTENFTGSGGFSKFFLGTSKELLGKKLSGKTYKNELYVGANVGYIFGRESVTHLYHINNTDTPLYLQQNITNIIGGLNYDFGAIYKYTFYTHDSDVVKKSTKNNKYEISFGGTASMPGYTKATQEYLAYVYPSQYGSIHQTLADTSYNRTDIMMPSKYGFGMRFKKNENFSVSTDFNYTTWSKFRYFDRQDTLKNNYYVSVGAEWTPKSRTEFSKDFLSYFNSVSYRGGVKYGKTFFTLNGKQADDISVSYGMGFPISVRDPLSGIYRKVTAIDFGVTAGSIGNLSTNLINQTYVRLSLGFHLYDMGWFYKRKID